MRESDAIETFRRLLKHVEPAARDRACEALRGASRNTEWHRNQPCDSVVAGGRIACVLDGAVRKYSIRPEGQRQIVDLLIAGDFLGLSPTDPGFSIEAVSDGTRIACFQGDQMASLVHAHPAIGDLMRDRVSDAISRLENHLLVQGRTTAREKVAGYLETMARRLALDEGRALILPISRYDIADHLGLAVETVSRAMTTLRRWGFISLRSPRHIEMRNAVKLSESSC
jgi:CRP-like cAMP-binding protein